MRSIILYDQDINIPSRWYFSKDKNLNFWLGIIILYRLLLFYGKIGKKIAGKSSDLTIEKWSPKNQRDC